MTTLPPQSEIDAALAANYDLLISRVFGDEPCPGEIEPDSDHVADLTLIGRRTCCRLAALAGVNLMDAPKPTVERVANLRADADAMTLREFARPNRLEGDTEQ